MDVIRVGFWRPDGPIVEEFPIPADGGDRPGDHPDSDYGPPDPD